MKPAPAPHGKAPVGRPREGRIDEAVLRATAALLVEVGYADLTLAAVAVRADTSKPAIYRRWPSLAHLVHEAAFPSATTMPLPDTGSLAGDVRAMLGRVLELFSSPVARAALPGLLAAIATDPTLHRRLLDRFDADVWMVMRERLDAAVATGEARADVDPTVLIETVAGSTLLALLTRPTHDAWAAPWLDATTDLLLRGLTP